MLFLHGKGGIKVADQFTLRRDYAGLPGWTHCNYMVLKTAKPERNISSLLEAKHISAKSAVQFSDQIL